MQKYDIECKITRHMKRTGSSAVCGRNNQNCATAERTGHIQPQMNEIKKRSDKNTLSTINL